MKKFVLKYSKTRFQNAETRFQNAKTALSRIFFARTGMDSAQKKPALGFDDIFKAPNFESFPLLFMWKQSSENFENLNFSI